MAQEYDIVGGFIDPKALADVEKLSALYASAAENATKLIATADKTASQIGKEALMVEKLAALEQKTAEAKNRAAVAEEKRNTELLRAQRLQQLIDNQQTAAEAKRTKAVQDQTGYLNSLKAQVKDLTDQYMRLSEAEYKNAKNGTANTLGNEVITNLKKQRQELALAEQAYGNYKLAVGNYSSANKMFGINIGQVLKEMPNFAISARVGIMSLTNNLPLLAESFAAVRKEQKEMRAEQLAAVAAGKMQASEMTKMPSVLKMVAQGIFGLTGMMSILMVVMQAFGPAIIEWTASLFKGAQGLADMKKEAEGLITTLETSGDFKKGLENVANMDRMFKAAANGGVKESKQAVDEFNKTFNDTDHIFTSVNEAQDYFIANKDRYVKAMYEMAMSNHFMNKAVEKGVELEKLKSEADKPSMGLSGLLTIAGVSPSKMAIALKAESDMKISAKQRELDAILGLSNSYYNSSKELYNLSEFDNKGGRKPSGGTVQTAQIKLIQEEYYNKERAKLINAMTDLELKAAKTTDEGILNSYDDRLNAARQYFTKAMSVAGIDQTSDLANADQKFGIGNAEIEKIRAANRKKLAAKKITNEEFNRSEVENGKALTTLVNNYEVDILQAKDKFRKTELAEKIKFNKTAFQISQDAYAEDLALLKISQERRADLVEQEGQRKQAEAKKQGVGGAFFSAFTGRGIDTSSAELQANHDSNMAKLADDKKAIEEKIALETASIEEQIKLNLELEENKRKQAKETSDYKLKLQEYSDKKLADLQIETAKAVVEVLGKLWSNYYDNQEYDINKETEVFKAQETEKGKDVEDRLKAGVITQKQAEDEKARIKDYYDAAYKEQERKKQELETQKFYADQAMSIARIAMSTGEAIMKAVASGYGAALTPWILGLAGAQTALVLAQQPPKFAKGGVMPHTGVAELGDGGKNEFWISPSGQFGISPNTPTFMNLDKGTKIYPDINKIDMLSIIKGHSKYNDSYDMRRLEDVMVGIGRKLTNQKHSTTLKGMTLVEQFNQSEKLKGKTRSLMN